MTREVEECSDVCSVLRSLAEAAGAVAKDDLSALAKMHTWCETLATLSTDAPHSAEISQGAKVIAPFLEAIILGESADVGKDLSSVVEHVNALVRLVGDQPRGTDGESPVTAPEGVGEPGPQAPPSAGTPSDEADVVERLARVFDDEPASEPSAPEAATAEPPDTNMEHGLPGDPEACSRAEVDEEPDHGDAPDPGLATDSQGEVVDAKTTAQQNDSTAAADKSEQPPYEQAPLRIDPKELEFVKGFVEEAREHIENVEAAVLGVEREPENSEHIDNLFRPFHTIKGMTGFLNMRDINCLTHEVETLLDQGRKGKRPITPGLIDLIFDVVDILKVQVAAVANFVASPNDQPIPQPPIAEMIGKLRAVVAGRLELEGRRPSGGEPGRKLGENLVEQGSCAKEVVDFALNVQQQGKEERKTGEIMLEMGAVTARQIGQALRKQNEPAAAVPPASAKSSAGDQSVRIDTVKLDSLVDMVGELVIAQTQVSANPVIASDPKLAKDAGQVSKIVRDVQEVAMAMRMIPIGSTFQRMARLVRDVARKANKRVELHISGEETELDKNVIQQIGDPLVHMVRNAVDHGIEPPGERPALGKDETGHVYLGAFHQGGNIVIEISDDGRGLDPKKLIAKGIEKGLVQPGEELTEQQAYHLVFAPGFSTAEKVTDISGRGVGMDVVRRNIEQLRGKVDIASELGKGSTFSIRLPLTLAIIDGMVIRVGGERFIIPTIAIEQALRPRPNQIATVQQRGEMLNVRGRLIPLIQLGALFNMTSRVDPCAAMVVIAHCEGRQIGLVVEELIGQQQVVIKTLGERFQGLKGICGAAILGDGRVGLILETSGLAAAHKVAVSCSSGPRPSPAKADSTAQGDSPENADVAPIAPQTAEELTPTAV